MRMRKTNLLAILVLLSAPVMHGCLEEEISGARQPSTDSGEGDPDRPDEPDGCVPELDCLERVRLACEERGCDRETYEALAEAECGMPSEPPVDPIGDCFTAVHERCAEAAVPPEECERWAHETCVPPDEPPPVDDCAAHIHERCAEAGIDPMECELIVRDSCFPAEPPPVDDCVAHIHGHRLARAARR